MGVRSKAMRAGLQRLQILETWLDSSSVSFVWRRGISAAALADFREKLVVFHRHGEKTRPLITLGILAMTRCQNARMEFFPAVARSGASQPQQTST